MALDLNDFSTDMTEKEAVCSSRKLRIGIIGTGGIANSHIKSYLKQRDAEVVAGADLIPGKAAQFFERHGVEARAFEDYREMIDTMDLDAVSVCTYNSTHKECTIYALEHGLPVLLEKPMTVTLDEAVEICRAEKKSGKIVSVGFQPRFDGNMQMIKKIVESGELGKVYYIQTGGGRRHGIPVSWSTTFIEEEKAGIGAVGDIGCYSLDLVLNALGYPKPLTVSGQMTDYFGKDPSSYAKVNKPECAEMFSVDDFASAYIRLEGDIVLDFRIAWYMHLDTPGDTIIMGTKGALRIPSTDCWNGTFHKPMTVYRDVAGLPSQIEVPLIPSDGELFDKKIRSFLDAVITGGKAPVPTCQILYNQAIIDGIMKSSKLGHEVQIEIPEI
ncbi:MAG: Gfo/Idh/MocA family oxidoreductase [Lachnospiraceae bacterium]|nr:Gfo/Idh/MocA family oxidoreductase [Lachnospiraceae bacterium]